MEITDRISDTETPERHKELLHLSLSQICSSWSSSLPGLCPGDAASVRGGTLFDDVTDSCVLSLLGPTGPDLDSPSLPSPCHEHSDPRLFGPLYPAGK